MERLARHVTRLGAGEINRRSGNFLRRAKPAHRDRPGNAAALLLGVWLLMQPSGLRNALALGLTIACAGLIFRSPGVCVPVLLVYLSLPGVAQQAPTSDADLIRQGSLALAAAHGEQPRRGGKFLSAGNERLPHFDMHQTSFGGIYAATAPAYNCLVRTSPYDPLALDVVPELAHTWEFSDGGKTVTFHLHTGIKWHDGTDFTADDVKASIERIPVVSGPNPTLIYVRRVKEVKVVDPHTVHVVTDGPAPTLPNDFIRVFITSAKATAGLTKETANAAFNSGKAAVGTGPFKFVSWTPKEELVLERFDQLWRGASPWLRH